MELFPNSVNLIEVVDLPKCNFESIYIGANVGLIGSVIYQQDGGLLYNNHKFLGDKLTAEIVLKKENMASVNDVFIIILRTYYKAPTASARLLSNERILQTSSVNGTLYISDGKVNEEGEPAPFNWILFVAVSYTHLTLPTICSV